MFGVRAATDVAPADKDDPAHCMPLDAAILRKPPRCLLRTGQKQPNAAAIRPKTRSYAERIPTTQREREWCQLMVTGHVLLNPAHQIVHSVLQQSTE